MRLLKAQNTNLRNIYGKGVKYDVNDQVIVDSTNVLLMPKGTTAQRPTSPTDGHMRYNISTDDDGAEIGFEVYNDGAWRRVRFKEPNQNPGIVQQDLGIGDAVETLFGPLDSQDPDFPVPVAGQNILVFVENVFQIHNTNYTITQNPGTEFDIVNIISVGSTTVIELDGNHGLSAGHDVYIEGVESSSDPDNIEFLNTDYSSSPGHHNVVSVPAADRLEIGVDTTSGNIGNYISSSGRLITYRPGWYLEFSSPVDLNKPVTVLHNFDK